MADQQNTPDKDSVLFNQLVLSFYSAAWQHLGKIVNPLTSKAEINLAGASDSIDLLDMLRNKTKGNLTPDEDTMLNRMIGDLKLNYIEELNKQEQSAAASTDEKTDDNKQDSPTDTEGKPD